MKWIAYCIDCQKDLTDGGWNNGQMVEAQAKFHTNGELEHHDKFKCHKVIVGYQADAK